MTESPDGAVASSARSGLRPALEATAWAVVLVVALAALAPLEAALLPGSVDPTGFLDDLARHAAVPWPVVLPVLLAGGWLTAVLVMAAVPAERRRLRLAVLGVLGALAAGAVLGLLFPGAGAGPGEAAAVVVLGALVGAGGQWANDVRRGRGGARGAA